MKPGNIEIFCDFDGTITVGDTTDILLQRLADPKWEEIEEIWEKGLITSKECMSLQIPLIKGGWSAIVSVLSTIKVDSSFPPFVNWCRMRKLPVSIVSDGLDRVIAYMLDREGVSVKTIRANHLIEHASGLLELQFPHYSDRVVCPTGRCKCQILDLAGRDTFKVMIGDGRSDFCWAERADLVFAKDKLLAHCLANNIPCIAYESFVEVRMMLEEMLSTAKAPAVPAAMLSDVRALA